MAYFNTVHANASRLLWTFGYNGQVSPAKLAPVPAAANRSTDSSIRIDRGSLSSWLLLLSWRFLCFRASVSPTDEFDSDLHLGVFVRLG